MADDVTPVALAAFVEDRTVVVAIEPTSTDENIEQLRQRLVSAFPTAREITRTERRNLQRIVIVPAARASAARLRGKVAALLGIPTPHSVDCVIAKTENGAATSIGIVFKRLRVDMSEVYARFTGICREHIGDPTLIKLSFSSRYFVISVKGEVELEAIKDALMLAQLSAADMDLLTQHVAADTFARMLDIRYRLP